MFEAGHLSPEIEIVRGRIRLRWTDHVRLVEDTVKACHRCKTRLKAESPQKLCAAAVFLKLLSDAEGAYILLERGMRSQCRSLLRIALEASITLAKICQSPEFARAYGLLGEQVRLKMLRAIGETDHEVLKDIKTHVSEMMVQSLYLELKGERERNLCTWADEVGMKDIYETLFRLFSADVHTSPQSLTELFVFQGEDTKGIEWGPNPDYDCRPELIEIVRLFLDGLDRVANLFDIDVEPVLGSLVKEHSRIGRQGT
jgi:hypothetical protein